MLKSGGAVLVPNTLSPRVNTLPEIVSRMEAVASSVVRSQRAMSPAPVRICGAFGATTVSSCEVEFVAPWLSVTARPTL